MGRVALFTTIVATPAFSTILASTMLASEPFTNVSKKKCFSNALRYTLVVLEVL